MDKKSHVDDGWMGGCEGSKEGGKERKRKGREEGRKKISQNVGCSRSLGGRQFYFSFSSLYFTNSRVFL